MTGPEQIYTWRTIDLLVKLRGQYINWSSATSRGPAEGDRGGDIFRRRIGFLDGSNMVLR